MLSRQKGIGDRGRGVLDWIHPVEHEGRRHTKSLRLPGLTARILLGVVSNPFDRLVGVEEETRHETVGDIVCLEGFATCEREA